VRVIVRRVAIGLGTVFGAVLVAAVALYVKGGARLHHHYDVTVAAVPVTTDTTVIARGRHLAEAVTLCEACHGDDLSGRALVDEPFIVTVYASNLTAGRGGVGATYTDADFVRAIRHGVNPAGRGLMIMHSDLFHHLDKADLGAIISYIRSVPPVDHEVPATRGGPLGRILLALGMFDRSPMPLIAAEVIDHDAPFVAAPPAAPTAAYGGYLVSIAGCRLCHGEDLHGGPPIEEGAPPGPDITGHGPPNGWSESQFIRTLRTGTTPYGRALNPEHMPWKIYGRMTEEELTAIARFLGSLPASEGRDSTATGIVGDGT